MQLKEFNPVNCLSDSSNKVNCVRIDLNKGRFDLSKSACVKMKFKCGDSIVFHQDKKEKSNWYLEKVARGKGWKLRDNQEKNGGLLFNNIKLARELAKSVDYKGKGGRILFAGTPTIEGKRKLYGLLVNTLNSNT